METCIRQSWQKLLLLSIGAFFIANTSVSAQNISQTFYVSKNGNNSDGHTWATAWRDFDQIKWTEVTAQSWTAVQIDGGSTRMVYRKPLIVPSSNGRTSVQIFVSKDAGHNGQAVIAVPDNMTAIEIGNGNTYTTISGSKRSGLHVYGGRIGLSYLQSYGPSPGNVGNIEISHCREAGVVMANSSIRQVIVHDCPTNVSVPPYSAAWLSKCWIYNSTYARKADGIKIQGNGQEGPTGAWSTSLNSCVVGPGLRDGINCASANGPQIVDCLFINSTRNNIYTTGANMINVTSFMTRLSPAQKAHTTLTLQARAGSYQSGAAVRKSIVFGGVLDIPLTAPGNYPNTTVPFPLFVEANTQFRTTGNTTALSPAMVDPGFAYNVGALHNQTPVHALMRADFSLKANSPALGTGSTFTSVQKLLKSFD